MQKYSFNLIIGCSILKKSSVAPDLRFKKDICAFCAFRVILKMKDF